MSMRVLNKVTATLSPFTANSMVGLRNWNKLVVGTATWMMLGGIITNSTVVAVACALVWMCFKYVNSGGWAEFIGTDNRLYPGNSWTIIGIALVLMVLLLPSCVILMALVGVLYLLANFD